jgi:hypothetical protein
MVVIEVKGSGGISPRFERLDEKLIYIGRAPDNDVIIDDPYIDGHHLSLDVTDPARWKITDLSSVNGTLKSRRPIESEAVSSGDELNIGRTSIRIFDLDHQVHPAHSLHEMENVLFGFDSIPSLIIMVLAMVAYPCMMTYASSSGSEFRADTYLMSAFIAVGSALFVAAAWTLLTRLLRGDSRFRVLLNLTILSWLLFAVTRHITDIVYYNIPGSVGHDLIVILFLATILGIYVYLSLLISTRLFPMSRQLVSLTVVIGLLATYSIIEFSRQDRYVSNPRYDGAVYSPIVLFRGGESQAEYRAQLPAVFARADRLAD